MVTTNESSKFDEKFLPRRPDTSDLYSSMVGSGKAMPTASEPLTTKGVSTGI